MEEVKQGSTDSVKVWGHGGMYDGDLNKSGQAHGIGIFTNEKLGRVYSGTFLNNKMTGYCHHIDKYGYIRVGEMK